MKVEFQYFDDCPNWKLTHTRLLQAVEDQPGEVSVVLVPIESAEEAEAVGFRGSPSLCVDGLDLFSLQAASDHGTLSCRFYGTADGAPSVADLSAAIAAMRVRQATKS